ncbi:hypothetical protein V6Z12_D04G059100 [Gossypium hirsutum]
MPKPYYFAIQDRYGVNRVTNVRIGNPLVRFSCFRGCCECGYYFLRECGGIEIESGV